MVTFVEEEPVVGCHVELVMAIFVLLFSASGGRRVNDRHVLRTVYRVLHSAARRCVR